MGIPSTSTANTFGGSRDVAGRVSIFSGGDFGHSIGIRDSISMREVGQGGGGQGGVNLFFDGFVTGASKNFWVWGAKNFLGNGGNGNGNGNGRSSEGAPNPFMSLQGNNLAGRAPMGRTGRSGNYAKRNSGKPRVNDGR